MLDERAITEAELLTFDVIFSGAGTSVSWPSALKDALHLEEAALKAVVESLPIIIDEGPILSAVRSATGADKEGVRLEHLMELLGKTGHGRALVEIYDLIISDAPNALHLLIAELGGVIVTANMDSLHEQAALDLDSSGKRPRRLPTRVLHVHGQVGDDASIDTTISQYRRGLRPDAMKDFGSKVAGKSVLVVGWAGRDSDIAEAFRAFPPARLHWLEYPGDGTVEPTPDALRLLKHLAQTVDVTWELVKADEKISGALGGRVNLIRERTTVGPNLDYNGNPSRAMDTLRKTPVADRAAGLAQVLLATGHAKEAADLLRAVREAGYQLNDDEVRLLGRCHRVAGDFEDAIVTLCEPGRAGRFVAQLRNMNEVSTLWQRQGKIGRAFLTNNVLAIGAGTRQNHRAALTARTRNAQILGNHGHVRWAARSFLALQRKYPFKNAHQDAGIGNTVDSATWAADAFRVRGAYWHALHTISTSLELAPYGSATQLAYAQWKQAEILHLLGSPVGQITALLELVDRDVHRAGDDLLRGWVDGLWADVLRHVDPAAAKQRLWGIRTLKENHGPLSAYLLLQAAELARGANDLEATHLNLDQLDRMRHLKGAKAPSPSALLAGRLIRAELIYPTDPSRSIRDLGRIRQAYQLTGMKAGEMRAKARLASARDDQNESTLVRLKLRNNWPVEAAAAASRDWKSWPVLM
jgi:hypothetical protein